MASEANMAAVPPTASQKPPFIGATGNNLTFQGLAGSTTSGGNDLAAGGQNNNSNFLTLNTFNLDRLRGAGNHRARSGSVSSLSSAHSSRVSNDSPLPSPEPVLQLPSEIESFSEMILDPNSDALLSESNDSPLTDEDHKQFMPIDGIGSPENAFLFQSAQNELIDLQEVLDGSVKDPLPTISTDWLRIPNTTRHQRSTSCDNPTDTWSHLNPDSLAAAKPNDVGLSGPVRKLRTTEPASSGSGHYRHVSFDGTFDLVVADQPEVSDAQIRTHKRQRVEPRKDL